MRSQLSFEPHPFIRPPSRSRVYLCPFRGRKAAYTYGRPLLPSRFRVPAYLKRARKRSDAKTKGRENEKTNWFSRFLATIIQLKSYTKTRQRGYELLNPRPTQTLVFVSAFPRPSLFRFRAPLCFVSAPLSVSFPRPSLFRFLVLVT